MENKLLGLTFAIATAVFWGLYGPALTKSRVPGDTPFKPFVLIGLAYLVWGILGGLVAIKLQGKTFNFPPQTISWGFIAGSLGAFGALTLTYAMFASNNNAHLVMPVVFGGATMVSALTGLWLQGKLAHVHPMQLLGFGLVIAGVVCVQLYSSHGPAKPVPAPVTSGEVGPHG